MPPLDIYNKTLLERHTAFKAAMDAANLKPNPIIGFFDKILAKDLTSSGRHEEIRHQNAVIWILDTYVKAVSKTLKWIHEASGGARTPSHIKTTADFMTWAFDALLPFAFQLLETWTKGIKNLVLTAWYSHGEPNTSKTLQAYTRNCRNLKKTNCFNSKLVTHTLYLSTIQALVDKHPDEYNKRYKTTLKDLTVAITEAYTYTLDMVLQLKNIQKKNHVFSFNGFNRSINGQHADRFDTWWIKFKTTMAELKEHGIRSGQLPYAIQACASTTPTPERNVILGPPTGPPIRKRTIDVTSEPEPEPEPITLCDYVPETPTPIEPEPEPITLCDETPPPTEEEDLSLVPAASVEDERPAPAPKKAKKNRELVDVVTGETYSLNVTGGNARSGNWHRIPAGVKYLHCPYCDTAYEITSKNRGYADIKVNPSKDGRLPVDQMISQDECRHLPHWKKMRLHLHKCVVAKKIAGNPEEEQQYQERGVQYLEAQDYYPELFKSVKFKNDQRLIRVNGKYDQTYARKMREQRKIDAAVALALKKNVNRDRLFD